MLDPKLFLDEDGSAGVEAALKDRGVELDLSRVRSLAEERKSLKAEADQLKNRLNVGSKEIGLLMRDGRKAEAKERKAEMKELSDRISGLDERVREAASRLEGLALYIPNIPDPGVPRGRDEADNVELRKWGEPGEFDFEPKDHVEIGVRFRAQRPRGDRRGAGNFGFRAGRQDRGRPVHPVKRRGFEARALAHQLFP
jgi:seryl-tRNA synthetase